MTTFGDQVYQHGGVPVGGPISQGKAYHIKPGSGTAGGGGLNINDATSTVAGAHTLMTADQNDTAYMYAEDNSASGTTDYQASALTWSKDGTHLIGANSGCLVGQRSRIAQLSTATAVSPLLTWSANNASMQGIHLFHGVADATSKIAMSVTGDHNYFYRNHIAGIGADEMDVATACSLSVSGSENVFEDCTIGIDTIGRGAAATYEVLLSGGATRNIFRNCRFVTYANAATMTFVTFASAAIDRYTIFEDCIFMNMPTGIASGTTMTGAFDPTGGGSPDGLVLLKNCTVVGATDWEATGESARLFIDGAAPTNNTSGLAVLVETT